MDVLRYRSRALTFGSLLALIMIVLSIAVLRDRLLLAGLFLAFSMAAIAAIDIDEFRIPDWISLPAIPLGLVASGNLVDPAGAAVIAPAHAIAAVLGGGSLWLIGTAYQRLRGRVGIGFGDVKLAAVAGAWVGPERLSLVLLVASVAALVVVAFLAARARALPASTARVPFGAFLAPAIWLVWTAFHAGLLH